jgi:hypothetical protein
MKKLVVTFCSLILCCVIFTVHSLAQDRRTYQTVSARDKTAIIEIFKTLTSPYYLEFDKGGEVYGSKQISKSDLALLRDGKSTSENKNVIIYLYENISLLFVINKTKTATDLVGLLGKVNADKLKTILDKYLLRDPGD